MPKRRRVANLLALAVLSAVFERPMHPYEMASVLRSRDKDKDMGFKWGSLYTVVQNLEKHGLLEVAENAREGGRPERTIYQITDDGRAEMTDWVRELIAVPERESPRFKAGLSVLGALGPDEAIELLRQRLEVLEERLTADRKTHAGLLRETPRLFLIEEEYDLAILRAEVAWVRKLLAELGSGEFPGLSEWRSHSGRKS